MDDHALSQLILTAVALTGELAELRTELVEVRQELGALRRVTERPYRARLRNRERRHAAKQPNAQANATAPVHESRSGPECRTGNMSVEPHAVRETEPKAAEIAKAVVGALTIAVRAEFITAGNAEAVTGQDLRWVVAEAKRLGVPIGGTGKKRVVDIATFRAALAKGAAESRERETDANDPVSALRRQLGYTLREDGHA